MSIRRKILSIAMALTALAGLAAPAAADEPVRFRLDFRLSGYHLPYYWAKAKGYYAAEKLDVDIKEGSGSGQTVNLVNAGEADIGLADYLLMANGVAKGMPLVGVFGILQKNPWAVISRENAAIKTPKDLEGKTIAVIADHKPLLDLLMKTNDVAADKVQVRVVNVAVRNTIFAEKKVDGFVSVAIGSPTDLVVRARHGQLDPVYFMQFADFGVAPLGQGLLVTTDYLAKKPDTIRAFIKASTRATEEVMKPENVDEAVAIALKETGASADRAESLKAQWEQALAAQHTANSAGKPLGWMSEKDWATTLDVLARTTEVAKLPQLSQIYTNALIEAR